MQRLLLGFCGGAMVLALPWQTSPALPRWLAAAAAAGLTLLALAVLLRGARGASGWSLWAGVGFGLLWSGVSHDAALLARLDTSPEGDAVTVTARVIGDPERLSAGAGDIVGQRFEVRVLEGSGGAQAAAGRRLRLSWYGGPQVAAGEAWHLTAVIRGPWSYANPGGFDYERWLLGAGLHGTGYVRQGTLEHPSEPGLFQRARLDLRRQVERLELQHGGVLLALLIGDGAGIPDALWQDLRDTGTVHLMVISGLHVSLAAALGFALGTALARICPWLPLWVDVRAAGCAAGFASACVYVALAGAGLPALRALAMSSAALALLAGGRTARLGGGMLVALAALLAVEPLAIHQQGFWLSFGAVVILYLALGHRHGGRRLTRLLRAQAALSLGMLPFVALGTGTLAWTGLAANLVTVPVMSLAVVPAVLAGACVAVVSDTAAGWLLIAADVLVGAVLQWIQWLALVPAALAHGSALALALAGAGSLAWLLGLPRHYLPLITLCWALPMAAPVTGLAHGELRVIAMDVGQGSAIAIDTLRHRLLYDAGPAFPSGFEAGSAVVVPTLLATGSRRLDALILSHDDLDHVGGSDFVRDRLSPRRVLGGGPSASGSLECRSQSWRWDGVEFRVLDVPRPSSPSDNDRSCILLVDDGRHRVLIAGDVGRRVEAGLLRSLAGESLVPVQLMFAPHHGSRSSSSPALVRVAQPRLTFVSAGWGNRFGHPHPEVVARYRQIGARIFRTGRDGALVWHSGRPDRVVRWRKDRGPYWRSRGR